ncbi:hypothetical protein ACSBR1_008145 [Camellia fascicularis]
MLSLSLARSHYISPKECSGMVQSTGSVLVVGIHCTSMSIKKSSRKCPCLQFHVAAAMVMTINNQGDFRYIKYFGESEDHLNLVELEVSNAVEFKVYEMESDYSGWFVKYCVDLHEVIPTFLEMIMRFGSNQCYLYSILGIVRRENDGEYFLLLCTGGKIISYSLEDKRFKKSSHRHGLLGTDECTRITLPFYFYFFFF